MFAALEKRDAELLVARQLIRKLQEGALSEHNGVVRYLDYICQGFHLGWRFIYCGAR